MHMKKCITIHLLLGNIRPELGTVRCRFFGASRGLARTLPWNCWGLVAPKSTQMYCAMTDGHCMLCLRNDTRPRPKDKTSMTGGGGGAPLIGRAASPEASLPQRHWLLDQRRRISLQAVVDSELARNRQFSDLIPYRLFFITGD